MYLPTTVLRTYVSAWQSTASWFLQQHMMQSLIFFFGYTLLINRNSRLYGMQSCNSHISRLPRCRTCSQQPPFCFQDQDHPRCSRPDGHAYVCTGTDAFHFPEPHSLPTGRSKRDCEGDRRRRWWICGRAGTRAVSMVVVYLDPGA